MRALNLLWISLATFHFFFLDQKINEASQESRALLVALVMKVDHQEDEGAESNDCSNSSLFN